MTTTSINAKGITINGITYEAGYSLAPNGNVYAFVKLDDQRMRIRIEPAHDHYAEALAAYHATYMHEATEPTEAATEPTETATEPTETDEPTEAATEPAEADEPAETATEPTEANEPAEVATEPTEANEPVEFATEPTEANEPASPKRTTIKEPKPWSGMEIKGKGWKIVFDGGYDRTRVIFNRKPPLKVREMVKTAGFWWSPVIKSWNKKLTNKAFKSAQVLAIELRKVNF